MLTQDLAPGDARESFRGLLRRWAMLVLVPVGMLMAAPVAAAEAPVAVGAIDDVMMFVDEPRLEINFYGVFSNRPTDCTAESSDENVVRLEHEGYDITLIPVGPGTATVTVVAWNVAGIDETEFTVTVKDREPQAVGELGDITLVVGDTESVDFSAGFTGTNLVYSLTSTDDSVATATADGTMAAVQAHAAGTTEVTVTASNSAGSAMLAFRTTVQDIPPMVAKTLDDLALTVGDSASVDFAKTFSGTALRFSMAVSDPDNAATATRDGDASTTIDVEALAHGEATVRLTASNTAGSVSETFTIAVRDQVPMAAGELAAVTLVVGETAEVDISEAFTGNALVYSVASSSDANATAALSGQTARLTALVAGSTTVTVTASNASGTAKQEFMVTVEDIPPLVAKPLDDLSLTVGDSTSVDFAETFSGTALSFSMAVSDAEAATATRDSDASTTVDVEALAHGETTVTLTASNTAGSVSETFTIAVRDQVPMAAGELAAVTLVVGETAEVDFSEAFTGNALVYSVASSSDANTTATLSGQTAQLTALAAGNATVTVTASNASGTATQEFMVTVEDIPPMVAKPLDDLALTVGDSASVDFAETFSGTALSFSMAVSDAEAATATRDSDASTTIDVEALSHGESMVTVTASNSAGSVSETFTIMVSDQTPMAVGELAAVTLIVGDTAEVDFSEAFTGNALVYAVASSSDANATATLSGQTIALTALVAGNATVTVTASNASGSAMHEFLVTVQDQVPATVGSLPNLSLTTGGGSETVEASGAFTGTALTYSVTREGNAFAVTRGGSQVTVSPLVEGEGTVTVTAANTAGTASQTFRVTVSTDAAEADATERSLAAIGASTLSSVQSAIGARFRAARGIAKPAAGQSTWQGQRIGVHDHWGFSHHASRFGPGSVGTSFVDDRHRAGFGTGFGMHRAAAADVKWEPPAEWTFWGHVDRQSFEASAYDGGVSSVYFGADADFGERWMAGFAVSSSSGEADYEFAGRGASGTGSLDTELTSVFPYLHGSPSEDAEVWAIVGAGWGDVTQARSTTTQRGSADLSMWMLSLGGRRSIASADAWDVSILGDTSVLELQTDGGIGIINGLEVGVARQRAGMEAARLVTLQDGGSLAWFGEVAARHDSGDGETGAGGELIGGVRFDSGRLSLEAKARLLALHAADDYEENGLSLTATVRPAQDGTGMSLSVSAHSGTGMGAAGSSAILDSHQPGLGALQVGNAWGMSARIGHSLAAMRQPGSMTPFAEWDVSPVRGRTMLGIRYDLSIPNAPDRLNLEFATGHGEDQYRGSGAITELRAALRF
ncbi:MAG: hypothetical protein OXI55_09725 [Gammaproteobacteria bacterium]|nr:hypothetical protein [Gammaproteobacteria bacterium]